MRGETIDTVFRLNGEQILIGRSPASELRLASKYVSWKHAAIDCEGSRVSITDLCSRNGTLVNDKSIVDKAYLSDGDVISIGLFTILFHMHGQDKPTIVTSKNEAMESPDAFRVLCDAIAEDPELLIADVDTIDLETEDLLTYGTESPEDQIEANEDSHGADEESQAEESHAVDVAAKVPLDFDMIDAASQIADAEQRSTLEVLEEQSGYSPQALTTELARIFDFKTMDSHELMSLAPDFDRLSIADARNHQCILLKGKKRPLAAICDPFDADLRPWLESRVPATLDWVLVGRSDLRAYISRHEQSMRAMDSVATGGDGQHDPNSNLEDLSLASISMDSSPVIKLVHSTLYDALRTNASDIHMEAGHGALEIRYRIDGVLVNVATVKGAEIAEQVVSRIKVMSELDISERRIPQDGRFKSAYDGRPIDFRVSIMPSSYGEDAVLRVLDKQAVTNQMTELRIESLGFEPKIVESLRHLSEMPYGMLLATGPTGSGKTTTLYAAISESNTGLGKIVTIEDPVEYQLAGVLQIPVNEKKGLTFARGLRSILRHDPDKIMVGEIRDPETAQIAVQSALTGHLVFTTVHANNVFDVLSRFTHMGVDPYSFVSALNGILAQRLLRVICTNCAESIKPTPAMIAAAGEDPEYLATFNWMIGRGCGECRGTGYRGRKAIGELLVLNDEIREAIIGRVPVRQLKELARNSGLEFIRTAAMNLVRDGLTTIDEVNRVTTMA
jgi:general secretion pathway protein E